MRVVNGESGPLWSSNAYWNVAEKNIFTEISEHKCQFSIHNTS